jgi:hypothetical protein
MLRLVLGLAVSPSPDLPSPADTDAVRKENAALQQRCTQLSEAAEKAGRGLEKDPSHANEVAELTKSCTALRAQVRVQGLGFRVSSASHEWPCVLRWGFRV